MCKGLEFGRPGAIREHRTEDGGHPNLSYNDDCRDYRFKMRNSIYSVMGLCSWKEKSKEALFPVWQG